MLRKKTQGFTLIELMVVIVIIGVLASLAIPRFTEASDKAKVAEAPRVMASFEGAYLAAKAETAGTTEDIDADGLVFEIPGGTDGTRWFTYTFNDAAKITQLKASPGSKIGQIAPTNILDSEFCENLGDNGDFQRNIAGLTGADYTKARRKYFSNFLPDTKPSACP